MSSSRQKPPGWVTVVRDTVSLVCAWAIVFKQAGIIFDPPSQLSEPLLWLAGAMIGVPGVGQILALRFGGGDLEAGTGTDGPQSGPPVAAQRRSRSRLSKPSGGETDG